MRKEIDRREEDVIEADLLGEPGRISPYREGAHSGPQCRPKQMEIEKYRINII